MLRLLSFGLLLFSLLCFPVYAKYLDEVVRVTRVIDGDTIEVIYQQEIERVRLYGIDCPERGEKGFSEATDYTKQIIAERGNIVKLEFPKSTARKRDNFGRLLAIINIDDKFGYSLNLLLVEYGHAVFTKNMTYGKVTNGRLLDFDELLAESDQSRSTANASNAAIISNPDKFDFWNEVQNYNYELQILGLVIVIGGLTYLAKDYILKFIVFMLQIISIICISVIAVFRGIYICARGIIVSRKSAHISVLEQKCFDICDEFNKSTVSLYDNKELKYNIRQYIKINNSNITYYLIHTDCDLYKAAYFLVINIIEAQLLSGDYFIYRGVLNQNGKYLFELYNNLLCKMNQLDYISCDEVRGLCIKINNEIIGCG